MHARRTAACALAAAIVLAACSGDDDSDAGPAPATESTEAPATESTEAPATTEPPATTAAPTTTEPAPTTTVEPAPASFLEHGDHEVGVRTITVGDRLMEVWYPVDPAAVAGMSTEIFDQLSVFPESLQPLIPPQLQGEIDTGVYRDAPAVSDAGQIPVLIYSHGFGGYRQVATNYTSHLASWGYVVISLDHTERGLAAQATNTLGGGEPDQDLLDVANGLEALAADADLGPLVDLEQVVITGHSAGAGTAARSALDLDVIDAYVSISGGIPVITDEGTTNVLGVSTEAIPPGTYELTVDAVNGEVLTVTADAMTADVPFGDSARDLDPVDFEAFGGVLRLFIDADVPAATGSVTFTVTPPTKPALLVIGEFDETISAARSTSFYEFIEADKLLVNIADAGHNSFTDSCAGIRRIGGLFDLIPLIGERQVDRANDGCLEDNVDPLAAQRVVGHYTVAFVRELTGQPVDPVALTDAAVADSGVTLADFRAD